MIRPFILVFFLLTVALCFSQEVKSPEGYLIKSIYFGGGSSNIDQVQKLALIHFLDSIPGVLSYTITIHSHTDNIGGQSYNDWLSKMRSEKAVQQLVYYGFEQESVEIKDFGMLNPVYDNNTFIGRLKNRRVDIIFWPQVM